MKNNTAVIVIICIAAAGGVFFFFCCGAALLLPAVQAAREASRRMQCGNNIKQMALGLQNYHDTFQAFPYGARTRTTGESETSWGSSWTVAMLPYCEEGGIFDAMDNASKSDAANDYLSAAVRASAYNQKIKIMLCPSSPLPEMQSLGSGQVVLLSYAGITGAANDTGGRQGFADVSERLVAGPYGGSVAGNGMLPINECLSIAACTDGTANTILLGEVSDWYYTDAGKRMVTAVSASDAGDGPNDAAGWMAGSNLGYIQPQGWTDKRPAIAFKGGPAIPADRVCNVITIQHGVGTNNRRGASDPHPNWGSEGIGRCGLNNPLLAAHPAGAMVAFVDGRVVLLMRQTDPAVLKRLASRDDGQAVPEF